VRTVLIVLFDGVQSLDVTGPLEVFAGARDHQGKPAYRVLTASLGRARVRTTSGLVIIPDADLGEQGQEGPPDLLIIPGGRGARRRDPDLAGWIRAHAPHARRVASVCTGAFLLAEAGLLDGRRATTHWSYCDALRDEYPGVEVDPDPIYVKDGNITTSAGVTAGIDLALALVEDDLGRDTALAIARRLVASNSGSSTIRSLPTRRARRPWPSRRSSSTSPLGAASPGRARAGAAARDCSGLGTWHARQSSQMVDCRECHGLPAIHHLVSHHDLRVRGTLH
jgi:transcriptional regulator GlxA family with amidase domain